MAKKAASDKKKVNRQTSNFMLSIPNEIRERMRGFEGIQWSAIATELFVQAMDKTEERVQPIDYAKARYRLIRSRFATEPRSFQLMYYKAMNWAANDASYQQLSNLAAFRDANREEFNQLFAAKESAHAKVAAAILGTDDENAILEFWQSFGGLTANMPTSTNNLLSAFVHGALEVFDRTGV